MSDVKPSSVGILAYFERQTPSTADTNEKIGNVLLLPLRPLFGRSYTLIGDEAKELPQYSIVTRIFLGIASILLLPVVALCCFVGALLTATSKTHKTACKANLVGTQLLSTKPDPLIKQVSRLTIRPKTDAPGQGTVEDPKVEAYMKNLEEALSSSQIGSPDGVLDLGNLVKSHQRTIKVLLTRPDQLEKCRKYVTELCDRLDFSESYGCVLTENLEMLLQVFDELKIDKIKASFNSINKEMMNGFLMSARMDPMGTVHPVTILIKFLARMENRSKLEEFLHELFPKLGPQELFKIVTASPMDIEVCFNCLGIAFKNKMNDRPSIYKLEYLIDHLAKDKDTTRICHLLTSATPQQKTLYLEYLKVHGYGDSEEAIMKALNGSQ